MNNYDGIWREIANGIRPHLSADAFQRWFAPIELVKADECALTLQVPNSIYQFWIESNYLSVVEAAAMSVLGSPLSLKFDTLLDGRKQIVLCSDRPAGEIANLEHRLVSRLPL